MFRLSYEELVSTGELGNQGPRAPQIVESYLPGWENREYMENVENMDNMENIKQVTLKHSIYDSKHSIHDSKHSICQPDD